MAYYLPPNTIPLLNIFYQIRPEYSSLSSSHNLRHHLAVIGGYLSTGQIAQAQEYISSVHDDLIAITLKRFCENELVNLLCSSFAQKAKQQGVQLTVDASLPRDLPISDTELCSILSNGLENALHAVSYLPAEQKHIELYSNIRLENLLIEIKNPYQGVVLIQNDLPVSLCEGHGYGCRSIHSIAEKNRGICLFEAKDGVFTMRVALPVGHK